MTSSFPSANSLLPTHNQHALAALRRHWLWIALLYAGATVITFLLLRAVWDPGYALRWLLLTVLFALRPLWLLWHHLDENHSHDDARLYAQLGYANWTTLIRGWFMAATGGFIGSPWPMGWLGWLPAFFYMLAVMLDGIDGYLARVTGQTTKLGETLDISLDAWGALLVIGLGVWYGQLPLWYLLLGFSRQLFMAGQRWLTQRGRPVYEMTPSMERRAAAAAQMGFLSLMLWPIFAPPTTTIAAVLLGGQLFLSFSRDWLVVSGTVNPASATYQQTRAWIKTVLQEWLPPLLRLASTLLVVLLLMSVISQPADWRWLIIGLGLLGGLMTLLGILPRFGALLLLTLALVDQQLGGFAWIPNGLLQLCSTLIVQLGGGIGCVTRAEDRLWYTRVGDKSSQEPSIESDESVSTSA
jgi:CDP-diacylglycerol--glycerol-3-phosphate 3-phosphatidyltransferase